MTQIVSAFNLAEGARIDRLFNAEILGRSLLFEAKESWPSPATRYAGPLEVLGRRSWATGETLIVSVDEAVAKIELGWGTCTADVAGTDQAAMRGLLAQLREQIPVAEDEDRRRPVTFWTYSPHGPRPSARTLDVPAWDDVADNYPLAVRAELARACGADFRPVGGQLLLWQGEPGTGKTWALRALIWEWRDWADFHYVVDPDKLFGQHSDYLMDVLFHEDTQPVAEIGPRADGQLHDRWKVLILEDTGELLAADAKQRVGQGLSRLLNVVDGIIGQGLRVLVLVTTNEELKALHPAVQRPGRCASRVRFEAFDAEDAVEWLEKRGAGGAAPVKGLTLAEMFARLEGRDRAPEPLLGFAA